MACVYCFGPAVTRRSRSQFVRSTTRPNFLRKLEREAAKYQAAGVTDRILLCFTCDPYQHLDAKLGVTRETIQTLHWHGLRVQVLTKGGSRALRDIDLFTDRDAFATTLTFLDDDRSVEWEPRAALPGDRVSTIRRFHDAGVPTWVSLEPVIDPASSLEIIRRTHEFVDLYKIGKLNYRPEAQGVDWAQFVRDAVGLLEELGKDYYIKKDLARYL